MGHMSILTKPPGQAAMLWEIHLLPEHKQLLILCPGFLRIINNAEKLPNSIVVERFSGFESVIIIMLFMLTKGILYEKLKNELGSEEVVKECC